MSTSMPLQDVFAAAQHTLAKSCGIPLSDLTVIEWSAGDCYRFWATRMEKLGDRLSLCKNPRGKYDLCLVDGDLQTDELKDILGEATMTLEDVFDAARLTLARRRGIVPSDLAHSGWEEGECLRWAAKMAKECYVLSLDKGPDGRYNLCLR